MLASPMSVCADEMETFLEWQQKYQNFLKENAKPLLEGYQKKLLELEKSAAASKNYPLAAKIKAERLGAAKELRISVEALAQNADVPDTEAITAKLEQDGTVTLDAARAELGGGVALNTETGILTGWTSDKACATWKLPPGIRTGGYEVELTYSCGGSEGGGSFVLKENTFSLKREAKDSGGWQSFRPDNCGTLRVKSASQQISLTAAAVKGAGLFQLKQVRLRPVAYPTSSSS